MGHCLSIIFLVLLGFPSDAKIPDYELSLEYSIDSIRANSALADGKSQVVVRINNLNFTEGETILYGYDYDGTQTVLDDQMSFSFELDTGEHILQFYPAKRVGYAEITTFPIKFESKTTTHISINFKMVVDGVPVSIKKPVIYLYPEEKTAVSVAVMPKGEMSFTYPRYEDQWNCTAYPSGEILINENSYNYLFWESDQTIGANKLKQTEGIVILKEDLIQFLENSLNSFGFTSQEKMDFITFWGPLMIQHEATEIRFMLNDKCKLFADLKINPKPDNLLRFYMIWSPADKLYHTPENTLEIPTQNRTGFTVMEWGGMEIPLERNTEVISTEN